MKRIIAVVLACTLLLTACTSAVDKNVMDALQMTGKEQEDSIVDENEIQSSAELHLENSIKDVSIKGLDDENLLSYVEDNMYTEIVEALYSEEYFVENVEAVYYPKEYI